MPGCLRTILIVDDDLELAEAIGAVLTYNGYQIILAHNGRDGMGLAREHHPDLILLDIMMPDMDGSEMMIRLRANPDLQRIPVICLTGLISQKDDSNGMGEIIIGGETYSSIAKPFDNDKLVAAVKNAIG
ncbi:MAG: response regulator [Candidatus Omnitrophica bacterium]|nr:response regulator [Candidatus Omnitrophota bacterium]